MKSLATAGAVRLPAVAGRFYPREPEKLRKMIDDYLRDAEARAHSKPKVVIAPHAGFIFSGPIAASSFVHFANDREKIKRIVLLGPSHHFWFEGLALSHAEAFATPLGGVPVDQEAVERIRKLSQVHVEERAHVNEHSLEVELPFLQQILGEFAVVPLVVGGASEEHVADVLGELWGGDETRIVISSDLSHYHDYDTATELDRHTADAIEAFESDELDGQRACGYVPIRGLLRVAQDRKYRARTVDLRNSGDTAGPRDRVVGYGAFVFNEN